MKTFSLLLMLVFLVPQAFAASFLIDEVVRVDDTITDDIYSATEEFNISWVAEQDVYTVARSIHIDADIGDDAHLLWQYIRTTQDIAGDAFIAGESVHISWHMIGWDAYIAGDSVSISDVILEGDAKIYASTLKLHNVLIRGDLNTSSDMLVLTGENIVESDLTYYDQKEDLKLERIVLWKVTHEYSDRDTEIRFDGEELAGFIGSLVLFKFFVLLVCSAIIILIARKFVCEKWISQMKTTFWKPLGLGFLLFLLLPIVGIILCFVGFTFPIWVLCIILFCLYFLILGEIVSIVYIFFLITQKKNIFINICALVCLCFLFTVISWIDMIVVWWAIGSLTILKYNILTKAK